MWLFLSMVWAEEFFTHIEGPIEPGVGATWSFPLYTDTGWQLASGQGGDLTVAPLDASGNVNMELVQTVTDVGAIKDHALRVCPDGTYVYTASTGVYDDILVYRLDADFAIMSTTSLVQDEPQIAGNDMAAICSASFVGIGVAELNGLRDYFWEIDAAGDLDIPIELAESPRMTGAGMLEHQDMLYVIGRDARPELSISVYDRDLLLTEQLLLPPITEDIIHYWPSSILPISDYFLLLSMGRNPDAGFPMDTGDVYLALLDENMELISWTSLTAFVPQEGGGMRPWMERHEDQVWISYDRNNRVELISLTLNMDFFPSQESSEEDTGQEEDSTAEPEEEQQPKSGGCAGFFSFSLMLLLIRNRVRTSDS